MELKPIAPAAIPHALEKAERYRLLSQSWAAESICLDVLDVDPENQDALVMLVLAITDQFADSGGDAVRRARMLLERLASEYQREYYAGIIAERRALAELHRGGHGAGRNAYQWIREAMEHYAAAETLEPAGRNEARLRWNTCVRLLRTRKELVPPADEPYEPALED